MAILTWISDNKEFVFTVLSLLGVLLKMRRDTNRANIDAKKARNEDERKRKNDLALLESKRLVSETSLREFFQKTITRQDAQITEQFEKITALETSRDELQDKVAELTVSGTEKDGVIANLTEKLSALRVEFASLRNDLGDYEKQNQALIVENHRLAKKINEERASNKRLEALNSNYAMQIADLQKQLGELQTQIEINNQTIQRLTAKENTAPLPVLAANGNEVVNAVQLDSVNQDKKDVV